MAKGQWADGFKNPPKWLAPAYLVSAILFTWFVVNRAEQGKDWGGTAIFALLFWVKAFLFWYQRRKVSRSQQAEPGKG